MKKLFFFCENHTKQKNTLCIQNAEISQLNILENLVENPRTEKFSQIISN
jgi:hypothetical protein